MYNSVAELHIGLDLALQQLNSNRKQTVKPEEKDWFLNDTLLQVLNNHIDPNAMLPGRNSDSDQRVVDYLHPLKTSFKYKPPVFIDETTNISHVQLPADYYRKSRVNAEVCLNRRKVDNGYTVGDNDRLFMAVVPFESMTNVIDDYTAGCLITVGDRTLFDGTSVETVAGGQVPKYNFDNILGIESKFMVIPTILEACNDKRWVNVYWESYNGSFYKNSFIFVVDNRAFLEDEYAPFGTNSTVDIDMGSVSISKNFSALMCRSVVSEPSKNVQTRIVESAEFDAINNNVFFDSSFHSLASVVEGGKILVKGSKDFSVVGINLVYYRRPKLINYRTNQNCEITADDFILQLVNLTAQKINAFLNGENYNQMVKENILLM